MYRSTTKSYALLSQIGHFHFRFDDFAYIDEVIKLIKSNG
jgi:hypothetical protein